MGEEALGWCLEVWFDRAEKAWRYPVPKTRGKDLLYRRGGVGNLQSRQSICPRIFPYPIMLLC